MAAASILGLNLVELEQHYLALYGVYATHMGQGKESAQVTMIYVISDLQKEAVAWDDMPALSLVAPTGTVNAVDHAAATLQASARRLFRVAKKSLLA